MDTPYGPHKIQPSRQVAIPKELAERLSLRVGDQVYFMTNDQEPGTLTVVPVELMSRWLERGRRTSEERDRREDDRHAVARSAISSSEREHSQEAT